MLALLTDTLAKIGIALGLLLAVIAGMALIQLALGYTKPNIGYQRRIHRGRDYTFFLRNLDSVHYKQPMHLIVSGRGLTYVEIQAGPWSQGRPVKLGEIDGRARVRVVLDGVPEEAAFAIRACCEGDEPSIEVAEDSPLQPRGFRRPLARFTLLAKVRYYGLRYLSGIVGFLVIFWGGLYVKYGREGIEDPDLVTAGVAVIIAALSYALVVPLSGKRTIVGYLTSVETDRYWGERRPSGTLPKLDKE